MDLVESKKNQHVICSHYILIFDLFTRIILLKFNVYGYIYIIQI